MMPEPKAPNPFDLLIDEIRKIVREGIGAHSNGNGQAPTLLSAQTAAKLFEVPKTWISEAARRGELPSVKVGHYVRFKPEDLKAFVDKRIQKNS